MPALSLVMFRVTRSIFPSKNKLKMITVGLCWVLYNTSASQSDLLYKLIFSV